MKEKTLFKLFIIFMFSFYVYFSPNKDKDAGIGIIIGIIIGLLCSLFIDFILNTPTKK